MYRGLVVLRLGGHVAWRSCGLVVMWLGGLGWCYWCSLPHSLSYSFTFSVCLSLSFCFSVTAGGSGRLEKRKGVNLSSMAGIFACSKHWQQWLQFM
jgi:hypothetical protein